MRSDVGCHGRWYSFFFFLWCYESNEPLFMTSFTITNFTAVPSVVPLSLRNELRELGVEMRVES
jgi:hypothetical protein